MKIYFMHIQIKKIAIIAFLLIAFSNHLTAQDTYKMIKEGNSLYDQKKYSDAEVNYRKSITTGKNLKEGNYNLGNAYFQQGKYEEAAKQYEGVGAMKALSPEDQAKTYHNLGNALLKEQKYPESIQAYKNALKVNPKDNDTRYNLAYAQSMIQKQEQQKNKDDKSDKNKDQDQQKKDQQKKDQQNKDKKDQEQKQNEGDQKNKEGQEKSGQAKKDKISKEDAEKILQALNNDEKKTQKKINIKQPSKVSIEKQW